MAGAMGTLGVLLEVSFKIMPLPARELTLSFECNQADAINLMNQWAGQPLPLSGGSWTGERLTVRLSGASTETNKAAALLSPDVLTENQEHWVRLREHRETFFDTKDPLWRIAVHSTAEPLPLAGNFIFDWGGALRWYSGPESAEEIRRVAEAANGHAILFRGESEDERFHPLQPAMQRLQQRVRQAFDPHGLFNPNRMGPGR
jgi:glycolate oxidase FAD binding subunit